MRLKFEVKVREKVGPYKWVLRSKFFTARNPGEARRMYRGDGQVLWTKKVTREKALGIGSFFTLGDKLLREFAEEARLEKELKAKGGDVKAQEELSLQSVLGVKPKKFFRRYYARQRRETTH